MRAFTGAILLTAGLLLGACELPEEAPADPASPAQTLPAPESPELESPAQDSGVDIASIAALPGRMPFTLPAIERAFPGHDIVSVMEDPASGAPPEFHIRPQGSEAALFIVTPDWSRGMAGEIATTDPGVTGPGGIRPGRSRQSDVTAALGGQCARLEPSPGLPPACEVTEGRVHLRLEFEAGELPDPVLQRLVALPTLP